MFHGDLKGVSHWVLSSNPLTFSLKENILISHDGRALLADFGFSVLLYSSFSLSLSQPTGGTPLWMAPEKLAGYGDSAAADVYSFGMLALVLSVVLECTRDRY